MRAAAIVITGAVVGTSCALAVGRGSMWWVAVPAAAAGLALSADASRWRTSVVWSAASALLTAGVAGAVAYPQAVAGAINSLMVTVLVLGLCAAAITWRAARHLERLEAARAAELVQALREQQAARVNEALLRDRVRIAEHVHDQVGHQLNYSIVRLGRLSLRAHEQSLAYELAQVRADLATTLDHVGDLVTLLEEDDRSGSPDIAGVLASAVAGGTPVGWTGDALTDAPGPVQRVVASVLAEALANATRHAPGETVTIDARRTSDRIQLTVSNLSGHARPPGPGSGLRRTRQRIELAGGSLDINSGQRFVMTVQLPNQTPSREAVDV